jgi:hypothetical protein
VRGGGRRVEENSIIPKNKSASFHAMKYSGEVEVYLLSLFTSALYGC